MTSNAKGNKATAQRIIDAENSFADVIVGISGCTKAEGIAVGELYRKYKVAKMDAVGGVLRVTHGIYLDPESVDRALAIIRDPI